MSPYRRNVTVGFTVLVGLLGLATMVLKFGGGGIDFVHRRTQVAVVFTTSRADGLSEGGQVYFRGVSVGRITSIHRESNNIDVTIETLVANSLPGNVTGVIRTKSLVSGIAAIDLELVGGPDARPQGSLQEGQKLRAEFVGVDLIPANISAELSQAGELIKGLNAYVNDPAIHQHLAASIDNIHHTTDDLRQFSSKLGDMSAQVSATVTDAHTTIQTTQTDIARMSKQIDDRMLQLASALDNVQAVTAKLNKGQGTAALLLNDPRLYQSLVDNSRDLNLTIADLKRLVEQWEQEGVSFKLK